MKIWKGFGAFAILLWGITLATALYIIWRSTFESIHLNLIFLPLPFAILGGLTTLFSWISKHEEGEKN